MARARSLIITQFQAAFRDEASCALFLSKRRWPDGFVCPVCGKRRAALLNSRAYTYECLDCGRYGDAPFQIAAYSVVLGCASHVNALQWNVGKAVGGSTRPHL